MALAGILPDRSERPVTMVDVIAHVVLTAEMKRRPAAGVLEVGYLDRATLNGEPIVLSGEVNPALRAVRWRLDEDVRCDTCGEMISGWGGDPTDGGFRLTPCGHGESFTVRTWQREADRVVRLADQAAITHDA